MCAYLVSKEDAQLALLMEGRSLTFWQKIVTKHTSALISRYKDMKRKSNDEEKKGEDVTTSAKHFCSVCMQVCVCVCVLAVGVNLGGQVHHNLQWGYQASICDNFQPDSRMSDADEQSRDSQTTCNVTRQRSVTSANLS